MEVSSVGSVSAQASSAANGDAVAITVLKKAIDLEAQMAMQLVAALPQSASGTTATQGNTVNTYA